MAEPAETTSQRADAQPNAYDAHQSEPLRSDSHLRSDAVPIRGDSSHASLTQ